MKAGIAALCWLVAVNGPGTVGSSTTAAIPANQAGSPRAQSRLEEVRAAMGGAEALASIKSLRLRGTLRGRNVSARPDTKDPAFILQRVRISLLLPDHYLRETEFVSLPFPGNRLGFAGQRALGGSADIEPHREAFGYLVLALLMETEAAFPFALRGVEGDTLEFKDPYGIDVLVDLDPAAGLPRRIRYETRVRALGGALTGKRLAVESEVADYKRVGNVLVPHRLTTFRSGALNSELRFDLIEVNPPLTAADFRRPADPPVSRFGEQRLAEPESRVVWATRPPHPSGP
jgi:hypothetical protein